MPSHAPLSARTQRFGVACITAVRLLPRHISEASVKALAISATQPSRRATRRAMLDAPVVYVM